jgi:nucleotide-binding universal stress UspA family protein
MAAGRRPERWAGFRSILCPVDFSDQSRLALRYADAVARRARGALHVCYVNDPLLVAAASSRLHYPGLVIQSKRELQTFVETALPRRSSKDRDPTFRTVTGVPADQILKEAERLRADLIVLGTHGLTGAERLFLGSTTIGVLERAKVPVLTVPRVKNQTDSAPPPSWPGRYILAAVDLDGDSRTDVDAAVRIAKWFGSSLLLLHVIAAPVAPSWLGGNLKGRRRTLLGEAENQLEQLAAIARDEVHVESRVVCGRIAEKIAAVAVSEQIELSTTALRDRRGWFGARRGSMSYHVLTHATAPVLAYPPEWTRALRNGKRRTAF